MMGWNGRRLGLALGLLALWLASTYVEDWLGAPAWAGWAFTAVVMGAWLVLANTRRFR